MSCSAQSIFERACHAIGRPDLLDDPRFLDNQARTEHSQVLDDTFAEWIGQHSLAVVLSTLNDAGAAVAPIYDVKGVFDDPHFQARENLVTVADADLGSVRMQGVVPKLSRTPGSVRHAGARLGEHNADVYAEWADLDAAELAELRSLGVV
jgi:succinyl-CoA--D-citramalate CoA-transferase